MVRPQQEILSCYCSPLLAINFLIYHRLCTTNQFSAAPSKLFALNRGPLTGILIIGRGEIRPRDEVHNMNLRNNSQHLCPRVISHGNEECVLFAFIPPAPQPGD